MLCLRQTDRQPLFSWPFQHFWQQIHRKYFPVQIFSILVSLKKKLLIQV